MPISDFSTSNRDRLSEGKAFCVDMEYVLDSSQTVFQSFKTPATGTRVRLIFELKSSDKAEIQLREAPTVTAYSFSWNPEDMNNITDRTASSVVKNIDTHTSVGTFISKECTLNKTGSMSSSTSPEFILNTDTEYMFLMKSFSECNQVILRLQWYEV